MAILVVLQHKDTLRQFNMTVIGKQVLEGRVWFRFRHRVCRVEVSHDETNRINKAVADVFSTAIADLGNRGYSFIH